MADITCVKVNSGALVPSSGNPTDFEFWSKAGAAVVLAFRGQNFGAPAFGALDGLTAFATGGQANATLLASGGQVFNRVATVATGGDSVALPAAIPGAFVLVINGTAGTSMNVFTNPTVATDTINALSATTAFAVAGAARALFICTTAGKWYSITLAA